MKTFCIVLFLSLGISSCANLKEVHRYAINSQKNIGKFETLDYSFSRHCIDKCFLRSLEEKDFNHELKTCLCKNENAIDKSLNELIKVLESYFNGLADLSDNKLTSYSFKAIEKPLTSSKIITTKELQPYNNLTSFLTTLISNNYRANKLKLIIEQANPDVVFLLRRTSFIIGSNLIPTLHTRRSELQQFYVDLYEGKKLSAYEKIQLKKDYFSELKWIEEKEILLKKYASGLIKISNGHQDIFTHRNDLKDKDIRNLIAKYALELNDIIAPFKIKKNE